MHRFGRSCSWTTCFTVANVKGTLGSANTTKLMKFVQFQRNHKKQEFLARIMEDQDLPMANLQAYPSANEMVELCVAGLEEARVMASVLGMTPVAKGGIISDKAWAAPWVGETEDAQMMAPDHDED